MFWDSVGTEQVVESVFVTIREIVCSKFFGDSAYLQIRKKSRYEDIARRIPFLWLAFSSEMRKS